MDIGLVSFSSSWADLLECWDYSIWNVRSLPSHGKYPRTVRGFVGPSLWRLQQNPNSQTANKNANVMDNKNMYEFSGKPPFQSRKALAISSSCRQRLGCVRAGYWYWQMALVSEVLYYY